MTQRKRPAYVTPYTWNRHDPHPEPGVWIIGRPDRTFVALEDLRRIADALHDVADEWEAP